MRSLTIILLLLFFTSCKEKENIFIGMKINYALKLLETNGWEETIPLPIGPVIHESYAKGHLHLIMVYDEDDEVITEITLQNRADSEYPVRVIDRINIFTEETKPKRGERQ